MVSVINGFRWSLLSAKPPDAMMLVSICVVVVLLIGGLFYFKKMDLYFANVV
jgi:lipopolysaccharide transport system permease protein